jgi:Ca2+-binding RTX toxin-like protein
VTRVDIKVTTRTGFDTKYLFPGLVPHTGVRTEHMHGGTYAYFHDVKFGGKTVLHRFEVSGIIGNANGDLGGFVVWWALPNPANPNFLLGSVELDRTVALDGFSLVTPDRLVDAILESDETPDLNFIGNRGNDTLRGSKADDELDGKKGGDTLIGRGGDDRYRIDSRNDKIVETANGGTDTVHTRIDYTLGKNLEAVAATGSRNFTLTGNSGGNSLSGGNGADTLKGLGGNDMLAAAGGKDVLWGGKSQDYFMFVTAPDGDVIKDFKHAADTIMLSQWAHPGLTDLSHPVTGYTLLAPTAFHASARGQAHDADDRILYNKTNGKLYFDPDGNGDAPRQLIATLSGHPHLASNDFLIF